jgi:hypothetical protein
VTDVAAGADGPHAARSATHVASAPRSTFTATTVRRRAT